MVRSTNITTLKSSQGVGTRDLDPLCPQNRVIATLEEQPNGAPILRSGFLPQLVNPERGYHIILWTKHLVPPMLRWRGWYRKIYITLLAPYFLYWHLLISVYSERSSITQWSEPLCLFFPKWCALLVVWLLAKKQIYNTYPYWWI